MKYSLLSVTSFGHYIFTFVNTGFYRWRQTCDKMFCQSARVMERHDRARCFRIQWNVDGVKTLIKKIYMTGSIDRQRGVVIHAVCVCLPTSTKLRVSHSAKKINHRHTFYN